MLPGPFMQFFITLVRNNVHWEVFDELGKVASDISHCNVQWFLNLDEPVTVRYLISREQVFLLSHLGESVSVDHRLALHHSRRVKHQALVAHLWRKSLLSHSAQLPKSAHIVRVYRVLLL